MNILLNTDVLKDRLNTPLYEIKFDYQQYQPKVFFSGFKDKI